MTGVTKAVVCVILSVGRLVYQRLWYVLSCLWDDWCNKGCGMCYPVCGTTGVTKAVVCVILSV